MECKGKWMKCKGEHLQAKAMGKGESGKRPEESNHRPEGMPPVCGFGELQGLGGCFPAAANAFLAGMGTKGAWLGMLAQKGLGKGVGCSGWTSGTAAEEWPAGVPAAALAPAAWL